MSDDSAYRKTLRLIGRGRDEYGSVPEHLRGRLQRKDEHLKRNGARLFEELVKSSHGKNNSFRIFSLKELQKATNNFSAVLYFCDSFVGTRSYRGIIEDRHVAVKRCGVNEVISLSLIKHRNVVKLLGCCLETENPILVHELPHFGTLIEYIFHERFIISRPVEVLWTDRLRIATEIADALSYLHSELHITHGSLWLPQAVHLDEFLSAKLSEFDCSEIQNQAESSDAETDIRNKFRKLKDVDNFGNILLDLLCIGRHDISIRFEECKEKMKILTYVKSLNVSEKEMPQIEAYRDLWKRCPSLYDGEDDGESSMEEVARELRRIRSM